MNELINNSNRKDNLHSQDRDCKNNTVVDLQSGEVSIFDLFRFLWKRRLSLSIIISLIFISSVVYALYIPNIFRAEVLLVPVSNEQSMNGIMSNLSGLGGLASLAGVSVDSGGNVNEHLAILKSREFLWKFIIDNNLLSVIYSDQWDMKNKKWIYSEASKQPDIWDAYRLFVKGGILTVENDKKTGLVTLAINWRDSEQAAQWANELIKRLNTHIRMIAIKRSNTNLKYLEEELSKSNVMDMRQALFELIATEQKTAMLANTQKEFAFRVLDPAVAPDERFKPRRTLIVVVLTLIGSIFSVFFIFLYDVARTKRAKIDIG